MAASKDLQIQGLPRAEDRWSSTSSAATDPMYWAVDTPVQAGIAAVEDPQVYNLPMAGDR